MVTFHIKERIVTFFRRYAMAEKRASTEVMEKS